MGGSYALVGESVTLRDLMSTRMAGPPELMELESNFAKVMATVDGSHVSGNALELLSFGTVFAMFKTSQ